MALFIILASFAAMMLVYASGTASPSGGYDNPFLLKIQAGLGSPEKQYALALISEPDKAVKLYHAAAAKGHMPSRLKLGNIYGGFASNPEMKDLAKAIDFFLPLAEENVVRAQTALCQIYQDDEKIDGFSLKNYKKALDWCRKAADQNDPLGVYLLSLFYIYKNDLTREELGGGLFKGAEHLKRAEELGNPHAISHISKVRRSCLDTDPTTRTREQAYDCLITAALGDPMAQTIAGRLFYSGTFFEKDVRQAAYWFYLASEQGNSSASLALGMLYQKGEGGLKQNDRIASRYFDRVVSDENTDQRDRQSAIEMLEKINGNRTDTKP